MDEQANYYYYSKVWWISLIDNEDTIADGVEDQAGSVMDVKLLHNIIPMGIDSANTNMKQMGYLLMCFPFCNQL
jgi:hypothetical protein